MIYIIPNQYAHERELPEDSKDGKLIVKKIYWTEILDIARKYDNTGLDFQIENFVQIIASDGEDSLLNKNAMALLFRPNLIVETYKKKQELLNIIEACLPNKSYKQDNIYGIGYIFNKNYWIGLTPLSSKHFLSLAVSAKEKTVSDFKNLDDVYFDGEYYYVPYDSADAQNINKTLFSKIKERINSKDNVSLKEWLSDDIPRRKREIETVYGLTDKMLNLVEGFEKSELNKNKIVFGDNGQKDEYGIGYYFDNGNLFLGISPCINSRAVAGTLSLAVKKSCVNNQKAEKSCDFTDIKDDDWYYFPLSRNEKDFDAFLLSETAKEQQNHFNELVSTVLKNMEKYKK